MTGLATFLRIQSSPPDMLDIGDQAHLAARAKPILRLHKKLVEGMA